MVSHVLENLLRFESRTHSIIASDLERTLKMALAFTPASTVRSRYVVLGHFYSLISRGADPLKCRSVLQISAKDTPNGQMPDAVVVMMNPGSSRPIEEKDHMVDFEHISVMERFLTPTVPDTTQYQVMRIMNHAGWKHVRVINLSDLRDPKSGSFTKRYRQFEQETGCQSHSVFAPERSEELQRHLVRKPDGPIICAWGVDSNLNPLIDRAMNGLNAESNVRGLAKVAEPGKYFHPLPLLQRDKNLWIARMLEILQLDKP